jgi:uncharacterized protein YjbI with pentapeptide repeats
MTTIPDGWSDLECDDPSDTICNKQINHPSHGEIFCSRESTDGADQCFWHTPRRGKTVDDAISQLSDDTELLAGSNLEGAKIEELSFTGVDFYESSFDNASISNTTAIRADFTECNFSNSTIQSCDFHNSYFNDSIWADTICTDSTFRNAVFVGSSWSEVEFSEVSFAMSDWTQSSMTDSKFTDCDFNNSDINRVDWESVGLSSCNFGNVVAKNSLFWKVDLSGSLAGAQFNDSTLTNSTISTRDGTGLKFKGADLTQVTATRCEFEKVEFVNETTLDSADFSHSTLEDAVMRGVSAHYTDFSSTNLSHSDLQDADLKCAIFSQAVLFDADLSNAYFYGSVFENTRIDLSTVFSEDYKSVVEDHKGAEDGEEQTKTNFSEAIWIHRKLENLCRENELPDLAQNNYIRRKKLQQAKESQNGRLCNQSWWVLEASKHSSKFAESPFQVIYLSGVVVFIFALIYPIAGGFSNPPIGSVDSISNLIPAILPPAPDWLSTFGESLYFSAVTFTTLGSGEPATAATKTLAAIEALLGSVLLAFLIFVWGRKTTQ